MISSTPYRAAIERYIKDNSRPPDKFSHQARLYSLAHEIASATGAFDDDVLHAAAWMHDLGVFIGHRPENPEALATWDCLAYAMSQTPAVLIKLGFPQEKILAVVETIRTHQPAAEPTSIEGRALRDADILEQLGAIGILRTVSKVGRDTRFVLFSDALGVLKRNLEELPPRLKLDAARKLAKSRIELIRDFLDGAQAESGRVPW